MTMRRVNGTTTTGLSALVGVALGAGCASAEMKSTWADPGARGAELSKVAVLVMHKDEGIRRMAEDEAAKQIPMARVVPSYRVLANVDPEDTEAVKDEIKAQGFDGVLVMRLAGI